MFTEIFSDSLKIDETLERKLGCLLTDLSLEEEFPELHSLLKEPIFPSRDKPKHSRLCTTDPILVEEWKSMLGKLHSVNQDRIKLRKLLIHLLALIAKGSVAEPNFSAFLARSQNLNYELTKTFLEKERQKTETLTEVVQKQEKEIQMLKSELKRTPHSPVSNTSTEASTPFPSFFNENFHYFKKDSKKHSSNSSVCSELNLSTEIHKRTLKPPKASAKSFIHTKRYK